MGRIPLICQECGETFWRYPSQSVGAKYCSHECAAAGHTKNGRDDAAPIPERRAPSAGPIVPYGYCHCGCGQKTRLAHQTITKIGWVKGEPIKYIFGHINRNRPARNRGPVAIDGFKECVDCGVTRLLVHFWLNPVSRDGHVNFCRSCARDRRDPAYERWKSEKRRAMLLHAEGWWTKDDVIAMYRDQRGLCLYCNIALLQGYHIDHKTPLSRGGTNWPDNLCLACPDCNRSKGASTVEEFLARRRSV